MKNLKEVRGLLFNGGNKMFQTMITIIATVIAMLIIGLGVTLLRRRRAIRKHDEYRDQFLANYIEASECFNRHRRPRKVSENRK